MDVDMIALGVTILLMRAVYDLCRFLAAMERARVRREEWEVYAELQTRGLDPEPPGDDG